MAEPIDRKRIEEIIREEVANLDSGFLEQVIKQAKKGKNLGNRKINQGRKNG